MRNLKKVLALVIAFSMMLSVVAFAGYPDVPADADYADAVSLLSALNIIKGDDLGNFNPDNTITRAEFAAVVCRALGLENSATGAAGATSFVDVAADHWASGYINLATQNGIINGYGDGNFGPEDKVTYEQAVKMLVCALGFEPMAAQKGGYPTGYLVVANAYKITAGVTASVEAPRKTVAKLVYNALSTPKMDQTSFGMNAEWEVLDGKNDREYATLLTDMDIYIASGIVGVYDVADDTITFSVQETSADYEFGLLQDGATKKDGYNKIYDNTQYDLELNVNGSDIRNYATQYVDAYVAKDNRGDYDVLAVVPSTMGETLTILSDDIKGVDTTNKTLEYYVDGTSKTKKIKVANTTIPYSFNKKATTSIALSALTGLADDTELKFVEQNGDTSFDMIIATKYADARVTGVEEDRIKLDTRWVEIDYDKDVEYVLMDSKGAELELADFAEDDVVAIVANDSYNDATYLRIVKLTDSAITGTVTEMATQGGKNYVWIDGEKYQDTYGLKQEAEGTFFISMTGKIFDFEGTSGIGNYAYVLEAAQDTAGSFSNNRWELKLLTVDGGVAEYTLTEDASKDFEVNNYNASNQRVTTGGTKSLYDIIGVESNKWIWGGGTGATDSSDNLKDVNRLVAYRTNSKGEIKSLELIEIDDTDAKVATVARDEYNSKTQKLDGNTVEEDTVIFDITGNEAESAFASDISYLIDDSEYEGLVVTLDKEVKLLVITDGEAKLSNETGFAIVTEIKTTTVDGEDLVIIDYIQDMTAGQITFNDDSSPIRDTANIAAENLDIGDVIMFNANADGIVSTYAVLATISNGQPVLQIETLNEFDEDNEFVYGYIASEDGGKSTKYENVTVGFGANHNYAEISVGAETNQYSYFATKKNIEIKDEYITEDADWYIDGTTDAKDLATFFFARLVDETLVDIYTFGTPVEGKSNIEAVETTWVTCLAAADSATVVTSTGLADAAAAKAVDDAIDAISATVTLADKADIEAARAAYAALTTAQQALVTKLADLVADEAALKVLVDADAAQAVIDLIDAIPDTIDAAAETAIVAAETAYAALTADQQALVTNYTDLTAARTAFDALS